MTAEVALRPAAPARMAVPDKLTYARALAASGMLPRQYQGNPANLLYAVEYAEMIGAHPLTAVTGIFVIDGKPSASAALISALVRRAGHKLRVTGDAKSATAQIIRADDPEFTFEVTFTIEDAKQAGLTSKGVWKSYPAAMLKARAVTQCARDACEDALSGLHYTAEELGAEVNEDGIPTAVVADRPADRGPLSVDQDPWATVTVAQPPAETDTKWLQYLLERIARARTEGELRGLWSEMASQHRDRHLTDEDRADVEPIFEQAKKEITDGTRAVADAQADTAEGVEVEQGQLEAGAA